MRGYFARGRIKHAQLARAATGETAAVNEVFNPRWGNLTIACRHGLALVLFEFWLHKTG